MKFLKIQISVLLVLSITGCSDSGISELKIWMDEVKKETRVIVPPISEPKVFIPIPYDGGGLIDPFDELKLLAVFERLKEANDNGLRPNEDRTREALEAFPIDSMEMVGSMQVKGVVKALVRVGATTYSVINGSYLGQNFGKVINVTDSKIELIEVFQDAAGEWAERRVTLEKQEAKQ